MKRVAFYSLRVFVAVVLLVNFLCVLPKFAPEEVYACSTNTSQEVLAFPSFKEFFKSLFNKKKPNKDERQMSVYVGGQPLGFTMECEGVMVIAIGEVQTLQGAIKPAQNRNIKVGDVVTKLNGEKISDANSFSKLVNRGAGVEVDLTIKRGEEELHESISPALDVLTNTYRLGLWIRDNAAGVGTLTFVREDVLRFGALGHPVADIDTGKTMPVSAGNIYKCNIVGITKGVKGTPGELRGLFLKNGEEVGTLDSNNDYGVYGTMNESYIVNNHLQKMNVGFRDSVKTGKAQILCTLDGCEPDFYDIEIVKVSYQNSSGKKSMVIKVTDRELIEKTGGIVQGMSGSPIVQNNKLVGAVTHVFVSDPTKGFGVYIDWMIDN